MRYAGIIMRILCFCAGLALLFNVSISIKDEPAEVILAYAVLTGGHYSAALALIVLPWALPLKD